MNKTERHIRYMAIVIMVVAFPLKVSAQWNFDIVSVEAYINDHKQQRSLLLARSTLELSNQLLHEYSSGAAVDFKELNVDLAMLETGQLKNGYLTYSRQKTRQKLEIKWEKQMQEIVDRHHVEGSRYLLPILSEERGNIRRQYLNALHRMNVQLKKIGKLVNCPIPLTTYTARHCWASAAYRLNIPTPSISQALGHDSEKTTRIYLSSLDNQVIDDANLTVIRAVYAR